MAMADGRREALPPLRTDYPFEPRETNVQERLIALHHLDAPWRPADVEQREGRILRQGNKNSVVQIFRYVTEGSFDAYMWQTLETKAKFIAQVMSGDKPDRFYRVSE
jgi:hypothetical protein